MADKGKNITDFTPDDLYRLLRLWFENIDPGEIRPGGSGWVHDILPFRKGYYDSNTDMNATNQKWYVTNYYDSPESHKDLCKQIADEMKNGHERMLFINNYANPESNSTTSIYCSWNI